MRFTKTTCAAIAVMMALVFCGQVAVSYALQLGVMQDACEQSCNGQESKQDAKAPHCACVCHVLSIAALADPSAIQVTSLNRATRCVPALVETLPDGPVRAIEVPPQLG